MKITANTVADIDSITIKRNKTTAYSESCVFLEFVIKESKCASFGDDFAKLAFSTMRGNGKEITYLVDNIKPGKRVVYEKHCIDIGDYRITAQPELKSIKPIDGEQAVIAKFKLFLDVEFGENIVGWLVKDVGSTVSVKFKPQQKELPFEKPQAEVKIVKKQDAFGREVVL